MRGLTLALLAVLGLAQLLPEAGACALTNSCTSAEVKSASTSVEDPDDPPEDEDEKSKTKSASKSESKTKSESESESEESEESEEDSDEDKCSSKVRDPRTVKCKLDKPNGKGRHMENIEQVEVNSADDCCQLCSECDKCKSLNFNEETGVCYLKSKVIAINGPSGTDTYTGGVVDEA